MIVVGPSLGALRNVPEVCSIFCATANPVEIIVTQSEQGRGVLGVIDGSSPKGVEGNRTKFGDTTYYARSVTGGNLSCPGIPPRVMVILSLSPCATYHRLVPRGRANIPPSCSGDSLHQSNGCFEWRRPPTNIPRASRCFVARNDKNNDYFDSNDQNYD